MAIVQRNALIQAAIGSAVATVPLLQFGIGNLGGIWVLLWIASPWVGLIFANALTARGRAFRLVGYSMIGLTVAVYGGAFLLKVDLWRLLFFPIFLWIVLLPAILYSVLSRLLQKGR